VAVDGEVPMAAEKQSERRTLLTAWGPLRLDNRDAKVVKRLTTWCCPTRGAGTTAGCSGVG
jgi:hypothetical protein